MHQNKRTIHRLLLALLLIALCSSCSIFDKELEQDKHLFAYRDQMYRIMDSLDNAEARITAIDTLLRRMDKDIVLITPRKKRNVQKVGCGLIVDEYNRTNNTRKALEYCNLYIHLDTLDAGGYLKRAMTYQRVGAIERSLADYKKVLTLDKKRAEAYYNSAMIYENMEEYDKAIELYTQAIDLKPAFKNSAYTSRGTTFMKMQKEDLAFDDFSKAIKIDSTDFRAYCNRGNIHIKNKDFKKAYNDYNKALAVDSLSPDALTKRAFSAELLEKYDLAEMDYQKAIELDPMNREGQKEMAKKGLQRIKPNLKKK